MVRSRRHRHLRLARQHEGTPQCRKWYRGAPPFLERIDARVDGASKLPTHHFTGRQARPLAYQLCHVFLHELGHHTDRMTLARRIMARAVRGRGEVRVPVGATGSGSRYLEEFGLPSEASRAPTRKRRGHVKGSLLVAAQSRGTSLANAVPSIIIGVEAEVHLDVLCYTPRGYRCDAPTRWATRSGVIALNALSLRYVYSSRSLR